MILNERHNGNYFNTSKTGLSQYDKIINNPQFYKDYKNLTYKIKWMTPEAYIKRCARDIFDVDYERLFDHRSDDKIDKYADQMKNGTKFNMPIINYSKKSQDGLHRAISVLQFDKDCKIPVMVIYDAVPLHKFVPPINTQEGGAV